MMTYERKRFVIIFPDSNAGEKTNSNIIHKIFEPIALKKNSNLYQDITNAHLVLRQSVFTLPFLYMLSRFARYLISSLTKL